MIALLVAAGYAARGFRSGKEFLAEADALEPAPLLLDLRMPGIGGLDLVEGSGDLLERFGVVMISGHGDIHCAVRSIKAGAVDFIEKPFEARELLALLAAVGEQLTLRLTRSAECRDARAKVAFLSPREHEVLRLLLMGAPNKIVARRLALSVRTVEMHRAHMLAKLGAKSTTEALHIAMQAGVVPSDRDPANAQSPLSTSPPSRNIKR